MFLEVLVLMMDNVIKDFRIIKDCYDIVKDRTVILDINDIVRRANIVVDCT